VGLRADPFEAPVSVRYLDVDQQGVVFHMWYLAYFEDARNAFLAARGLALPDLIEQGCDLQLAHTEVDWRSSVRWTDKASVRVQPSRVGTTSFTIDYAVRVDDVEIVSGRTVYVTVAIKGAKQPIPDSLRRLLCDEITRLGAT